MPIEPLALAIQPPAAPSEDDYRALCAALSESERGRALLAEFARRSRSADTVTLLAAIERIEARLRADTSAVERLRDDLRMLLIAIRLVRTEIDAEGPAAQATKLAKLLDLLERRIDAMAEPKPAGLAPPVEAEPDVAPDMPEAARAPLTITPPPDEPELPSRSPASAQAPTISLVGSTPALVETPAVPAIVEKAVVEPAAQPALPPPDPLAAIMALSDDERLALFT